VGERQSPAAWFLIREHANGWVGQIEASDVAGKWHVAAYPTEQDQAPLPINGYVSGRRGAMRLADSLVKDHAPHRCRRCGPWRPSDDQRLAGAPLLHDSQEEQNQLEDEDKDYGQFEEMSSRD
jgi:hypothetical protein